MVGKQSTFLFAIFAIVALCTSICNHTAIDLSDPISLQLAQLDAIKCQIEVAKQQHTETLAAISGIRKAMKQPTNIYDVLLYILSSCVFMLVLQQAVQTILFYLRLQNDTFAKLMIYGNRCMSLRFSNLTEPTPRDIEEYRKQLSPPFSAYLCLCCCGRRAHADVIELA